MTETMRVAVCRRVRDIRAESVPLPVPRHEDLLLAERRNGI